MPRGRAPRVGSRRRWPSSRRASVGAMNRRREIMVAIGNTTIGRIDNPGGSVDGCLPAVAWPSSCWSSRLVGAPALALRAFCVGRAACRRGGRRRRCRSARSPTGSEPRSPPGSGPAVRPTSWRRAAPRHRDGRLRDGLAVDRGRPAGDGAAPVPGTRRSRGRAPVTARARPDRAHARRCSASARPPRGADRGRDPRRRAGGRPPPLVVDDRVEVRRHAGADGSPGRVALARRTVRGQPTTGAAGWRRRARCRSTPPLS